MELLIDQPLKTRGIAAYALSQGTDLRYPSAYRLSRPGGACGRLHVETLDRLGQFFRVQPGKLVRWGAVLILQAIAEEPRAGTSGSFRGAVF